MNNSRLIQRHSQWASPANDIVKDFLNATGKSMPQTIGLYRPGAKRFIALKDLKLGVYTNPPAGPGTPIFVGVIQVKKGDVIIGIKSRVVINITLQLPTQTEWVRYGNLYTQDVKEFTPVASSFRKNTAI